VANKEKEENFVLNEILAKLNKNEKLIGGGAIVVLVGWLLGLVLTSSGGYSWYGPSNAQNLDGLSLLAAIAAVVVVYLKYAPNMKITWPLPLPQIMLGIGAVAAIAAVLGLLVAFTYDPFSGVAQYCGLANSLGVVAACSSKPITLYLATIVVLVGGGLMVYGGYMEYSANKTTPAA
jgi:hypothetical protein